MAANNQGIMHLRLANRTVACKNQNAHLFVCAVEFATDTKQCKRCAAKFAKMQEIAKRKEAK